MGDRIAHLRSAIEGLRGAGTVASVSAFYEAEPVELEQQPWFLNCAVALETELSPRELLKTVLRIEHEMGRVRLKEKGPRVIDIDIVLFGDRVVDEPGLKIPHPAMHRRGFVLAPLVEIAPESLHPIIGRTAQDLLSRLPSTHVVRRM